MHRIIHVRERSRRDRMRGRLKRILNTILDSIRHHPKLIKHRWIRLLVDRLIQQYSFQVLIPLLVKLQLFLQLSYLNILLIITFFACFIVKLGLSQRESVSFASGKSVVGEKFIIIRFTTVFLGETDLRRVSLGGDIVALVSLKVGEKFSLLLDLLDILIDLGFVG